MLKWEHHTLHKLHQLLEKMVGSSTILEIICLMKQYDYTNQSKKILYKILFESGQTYQDKY